VGLASLFGILFILIFMLGIIFEIRRTSEYVTPAVLIMVLAIFDSFGPLIVFDIFGPTSHQYIPQFASSSYIYAALIVFTSLILFGVGYISVTRNLAYFKYRGICEGKNFQLSIGRIYGVMCACLSLIALNLYYQSEKYGSLLGYFLGKALRDDYGTRVADTGNLSQYLVEFESIFIYIFVIMAMILFFHRDSSKKRYLWGFLLPFSAWLLTLLTMQRGTQLNFFVTVMTILYFAKENQRILSGSKKINRALTLGSGKTALIAILAVSLFISYGVLRNYGYNQAQGAGSEDSFKTEIQRMIRGEGLMGLTWINENYGKGHDYLYGKTFFDMMLLPVPRLIYPNKPDWYGVADITRNIGGPETSQDAVTMPGEAIANFGLLGMLVMPFWGIGFGLYFRYRYMPRFRYIYAISFFQLVSVVSWMSFTGFVNSAKNIVIYSIVTCFVLTRVENKSSHELKKLGKLPV
jgi:oligosaccharide repeat unit polymerase